MQQNAVLFYAIVGFIRLNILSDARLQRKQDQNYSRYELVVGVVDNMILTVLGKKPPKNKSPAGPGSYEKLIFQVYAVTEAFMGFEPGQFQPAKE